jgi:hypothetical protein
MGTPTLLQFLARRWLSLLWMLICAAGLSWFIFRFVLFQRLAIRFGLPLMPLVWPLIAMALFLILDVTKLLRAMLVLHGTIVLNATPSGLTFRNTPTRNPSGHIARDDLHGLIVVRIRKRARKSPHALFALREDDRPHLLLVANDAAQLEEVRTRLAQTIGIEAATTLDGNPT